MNVLPPADPFDLSVVIVSYNTEGMLRDCLAALPAAAATLRTEVFVVDNASPDNSAAMVREEFPNVHLIVNRENAGFVRANNQALRISRGRVVALLNPDTEAEPESLTRMVHFLDAHSDAGAIGPKLLNTDGSLQKNGRFFPQPFGELIGHLGLAKYGLRTYERRFEFGRDDFEATVEVDQVSGACILVPRRVMEKVGALSEDFYMYYEETEWCWRIKKAGFRVVYYPESRVKHHWMGSVRQVSFDMTERLLTSTQIYYRKTAGRGARAAIWGVRLLARLRNRWIRFGAGIKAKLRKRGAFR